MHNLKHNVGGVRNSIIRTSGAYVNTKMINSDDTDSLLQAMFAVAGKSLYPITLL